MALVWSHGLFPVYRNEHIVQYIGTERSPDTLNIFLEYIAGGSIASLIDKFGPLQENVVRVGGSKRCTATSHILTLIFTHCTAPASS